MRIVLLRARIVDRLNRRIRNGELTERGLARITGISQPHVHNVLKGTRLLSPELSDQILDSLGMSVLDLFNPEDWEAVRSRMGHDAIALCTRTRLPKPHGCPCSTE